MSDAAALDVGSSVGHAANVAYDRWALQLASLASQHHLSEYSLLKYGRRGCPMAYAPLSLHLPDVFRGLRERQEKYVDKTLWWPCATSLTTREPPSPLMPAATQRAALATTGQAAAMAHPELLLQLSSALSEPFSSNACIKTSESHPINISSIIPPESLVAISSHLTPCKRPCPVLFEIYLPYTLDRIAHPHTHVFPPSIPSRKRLPSNDLRSSVTGALNAALHTRLSLPPLPSSKMLLSLKRNLKTSVVSDAAPDINNTDTFPTSQNTLPSVLALPTTYPLHPFSAHLRPPLAPSPPSKTRSSTRQNSSNKKSFRLGNLLLSSCPGKKVRLNGPARGRSAVCRDLDIDLRRMKMLGTRCVVCCLDDEELEFLIGVSWKEYCQAAHREGLDVLRIPLPEGLSPLSPKSLDDDLNWIIERYTLHGISVLVHCRGGVGRAGLFACCWMLKLGLCGWIETDAQQTMAKHKSERIRWNRDTVVRRDTLQLVERVIEVVRRRRSVKAIETLEQVQFLVEYVDYLRTCGHTASKSKPT